MKHISELMFDAILDKMLQRYSARYVALYLKKKAFMLEQESDAGTTTTAPQYPPQVVGARSGPCEEPEHAREL